MSFLFCDVDLDHSDEQGVMENLPVFRENVRPYVKELTFRWSDPSTPESLPLFDVVESTGIPFIIRTGGQWSDPEAFLRKASRSSLLTALIISDFDERYVPDSSRLDRSFFMRLRLFSAIRQACSCGIPVKTVTPVAERTERDLEEILGAALECGAAAVLLERGHETSGLDAPALRDRYRRVLARMHTFNKEGWPVLFKGCIPLCAHRGFYRVCGAGVTSCFIRSDGGVYLCEHSEMAVGNILEAPLHSFYCSDVVASWQKRQSCSASECEVKDECRGGCPFWGESLGTGMDPLADLSSLSQKSTLTLPIDMDEALEIQPLFELRRSGSVVFAVSDRELLRVAPVEESLFNSLLGRPSLREAARLHGEASLRMVFSLYAKGFISFVKGRVSSEAAECSPHIKREKGQIIDFNQNLLLRLSSQAEFFRRNNSVLVIHPSSLSFNFLPLSLCYLVKGFAEPCYFQTFCSEHTWLGREMAEDLVRSLYIAGVVEVNGVNFRSSRSLPVPPEEPHIELSLQCRDEQMKYMERESLIRILKTLEVQYRDRKKSIELVVGKIDEGMPEWLRMFFREKAQHGLLDEVEREIRLVIKELSDSAGVPDLFKEHSLSVELLIEDDSEFAPEQLRNMCSHGVKVILRMVAETPAGMVKQFQRLRDSGASFRLEPRINFGDFNGIEEWIRIYVGIFDDLYGPGRKNRSIFSGVIDFEGLIESHHAKRRKGGSCSRHPCGAGTSRIAFNIRGELFPCARMFTMEEFNCGSIDPRTDPGTMAVKRIEKVIGSLESPAKRCEQCSWRNLCPGGCPALYRDCGFSAQDADPACGFKKRIMQELIGRITAGGAGLKATP